MRKMTFDKLVKQNASGKSAQMKSLKTEQAEKIYAT